MFSAEYIKFKCLDDIEDDLFVISTGTRGSTNASTGSVVIRNGGLSILSTENSSSATSGGALTIGGGIAVNGDVHFSGSLFKNGAEYESQWTETSGNISYTSGNVYVDNLLANSVSLGMSNIYTGSLIVNNNVNVPSDVTGVFFGYGVNYFTSTFSVLLQQTGGERYQFFDLTGFKRGDGSGWELLVSKRGDDSGVQFTITSGGQLQYTTPNTPNFVNCTFRYTITQITDSGIYNTSALGSNGNYIFDIVQITNTQNATVGSSYGGLHVLGGSTFEKNIVAKGTGNQIGQLFATDTTVGIGTTSPGYDFDVHGNINFTGELYKDDELYISSQWTSTDGNLFYTAGNIGIGTTNPIESLDVNGNINFTGDLYKDGELYASSQWSTSAGNLFYTGGNVGIGTTIPSQSLDVVGNINFTGDLYKGGDLYVSSQWTSDTSGNIGYTSGSVITNNLILTDNVFTSSNYNLGAYNGGLESSNLTDSNFEIPGTKSSDIQYKGTTTRQFDVRFTGNNLVDTVMGAPFMIRVAIEIYSPSYAFISSVYDQVVSDTNPNFDTGFLNITLEPDYIININITNAYYMWPAEAGSITFQYTNTQLGSVTGDMIVSGNLSVGTLFTTAGNVGIGTTAPVAKLDVSGSLRITSGSLLATGNSNTVGTLFTTGGNVGIGTTSPAYKLDVAGDIYTSGELISFSDVSLKTDILTITNSLEKVNNLRGVYYTNKKTNEKSVGVIAQEVQKILPEVVKTDGLHLGVAYGNIIGLLVEAIKELSNKVDVLQENYKGN